MKIQTLIDPTDVYLDLEPSTLVEALTMVSELAAPTLGLASGVIAQGLLDRESLGSTAVGGGFAIPHCKIRGIKNIVILLARFCQPVAFNGPQGEAVRFVFVVLSPPDHPAVHLQVLSQIARTLKNEDIRKDLMGVDDEEEAVSILNRDTEGDSR